MRVSPRHRRRVALRAILVGTLAGLGPAAAPTATEALERSDGGDGAGVDSLAGRTEPHVLDGAVADVIVRVRGSSLCSGAPITGTSFVITAAHCVLDSAGDVTAATVVRGGVEHSPGAVLVNLGYLDAPGPQLDVAVLIMDRPIPGPAVRLGHALPVHGLVTTAGLQPIDTDGTLLRGTSADDRPTPKGVEGPVIKIRSRPSGCVHQASSIEVGDNRLNVGCGLVPGASGGGLFAEFGGELVLLGVISTVGVDMSYNGLAPMTAIHELLNHPGDYTHAVPAERPSAAGTPIPRA